MFSLSMAFVIASVDEGLTCGNTNAGGSEVGPKLWRLMQHGTKSIAGQPGYLQQRQLLSKACTRSGCSMQNMQAHDAGTSGNVVQQSATSAKPHLSISSCSLTAAAWLCTRSSRSATSADSASASALSVRLLAFWYSSCSRGPHDALG